MPDDHLPPELLLAITSEAQYDLAVAKINELLDIEHFRLLTVAEDVYLDSLIGAINAWDDSQHPIPETKMPDIADNPDLKHFLSLANAAYTYESIATAAARELADDIVNNVPCLDESALRGMCVFAGVCKIAPETASNMLQD